MSGTAAEQSRARSPRPGRQALRTLGNRNFRRYVIGQLVSNVGMWMHRAAQDWLVLQLTHHSGTAVGVVTALQFVPQTLFGLWGGVIADRYHRQRLLVLAQSLMALQALLLGVLTVNGTVRIWHVYVLAVALGAATAVDSPARNAFIGDMVGRDRVPSAVSVNAAQFNAARFLGPAAAGLAIASVGTGPVFFLNAASYLAVLAALLTLRTSELHPPPPPAPHGVRLADALRHIRCTPGLLLPITLAGVIGTLGLNFQVTICLMATTVFHSGAAAFGSLSSAYAAGSLLGALRSADRARPPTLRQLLGAAAVFGVLEAAVGLMPSPIAFAVLLVATGIAAVLVTTTANAMVQLNSDPGMRGRVLAVYFLVLLGGTPVGAPLVGWVAETLGARYSLVLSGLACLMATAVIRLSAVPGLLMVRPAASADPAPRSATGQR
ncbi:MFS transporter [Streptantibioticus ferralitis]|uniref:MFS transporter n=1 Tax=Streptantibioticus ferralitis TaxID=236510 RepID=A0ABT5YZ59_9ACTN|nr:MFS transporter [Streptantibioticus ferralitis]MDF2256734.1 MFS transporter [Streptantibioticus ferralitis]